MRDLVHLIAIMTSAMLVGSWFLKERKIAKLLNKPWYTPYISIPGIIIILAILFPIIYRFLTSA